MYLASATRAYISFAVSKLSRFISNPGDDNWHALERVLRYLRGNMSYVIHYSGHLAVLEWYSDSNWTSDVDVLYATSGYVFTQQGGVVSWRSCKQVILTRSTMKAKLTALDTSTLRHNGCVSSWWTCLWLKNLYWLFFWIVTTKRLFLKWTILRIMRSHQDTWRYIWNESGSWETPE